MTYIVVTFFIYKNKKTRENKEKYKKKYTMEYACKRPKKDPLSMLVKDQKSK
jgi:predicted permease